MAKKKVKAKGKTGFSIEQRMEAVSALESGLTVRQVAEKFGVSVNSIQNWKKQFTTPVSIPAIQAETTPARTSRRIQTKPVTKAASSDADYRREIAQLRDIVLSQAMQLHSRGVSI